MDRIPYNFEKELFSGSIKPDKYIIKKEKTRKYLHIFCFKKISIEVHAHIIGDEIVASHFKKIEKDGSLSYLGDMLASDFRIYENKVLSDWHISPVYFKSHTELAETVVGEVLKK